MAERDDSASIGKRFDGAVASSMSTARKIYTDAAAMGARGAFDGRQVVVERIGKLRSKLGEDYHHIFAHNPLVLDSLSRAPLLIESKGLLTTVLNQPWTTATLWLSAAGAVTEFQRPLGRALGGLFHYGPGHVRRWDEINKYMDSVAGSGHRLKYGHSVDFLPDIVERFGVEGVPAFFCHLFQDFTTVDGLPLLPDAWNVKQKFALAGISAKTATSLVSLSASNLLAGLMIAASIWKVCKKLERDKRMRTLMASAASATENCDYTGAVENYKRALELERTPATLIALGQVYLLRKVTRPYAHHAFAEAVQMLSPTPARTVPYHGAQLSLRGIAGLQALATAEVIGDRYAEYWQERVEDLVNATVHSFALTAAKLEQDGERRVSNPIACPPMFSAAINHYLAAQVAGQFPLLEHREENVIKHLTRAVGMIGRVAQQEEERLRDPANELRAVWSRTLLSEGDAEGLLAIS
jgi:hypothetical protein